eukprot:scaffold248396_cov65-Cyclotella_meneghiniana.AAC.4
MAGAKTSMEYLQREEQETVQKIAIKPKNVQPMIIFILQRHGRISKTGIDIGSRLASAHEAATLLVCYNEYIARRELHQTAYKPDSEVGSVTFNTDKPGAWPHL